MIVPIHIKLETYKYIYLIQPNISVKTSFFLFCDKLKTKNITVSYPLKCWARHPSGANSDHLRLKQDI